MTTARAEEAPLQEGIGEDRVRLWPDLSYWFNLDFDQLRHMPNALRRVYERAIPRIRAQHQRMMMDAAAYPHMKTEDQKRFSSEVNNDIRAGMPLPEPEGPKTPQEMVGGLAGLGIAVTEVDAEGKEKSEDESVLAAEAHRVEEAAHA